MGRLRESELVLRVDLRLVKISVPGVLLFVLVPKQAVCGRVEVAGQVVPFCDCGPMGQRLCLLVVRRVHLW